MEVNSEFNELLETNDEAHSQTVVVSKMIFTLTSILMFLFLFILFISLSSSQQQQQDNVSSPSLSEMEMKSLCLVTV